MPWHLHLYWGAVVLLSAVQIGRGIAAAGEWIGKARIKHAETLLTYGREKLLAQRGKK